jgi:glutathione synthase/RimK-type ligase-like ATP-grasp enzyme
VRTVKEILDKYQIEIIMPCFHYGALDLSRIADDRFVNDFRAFKQCNNKYEFMNTCEKNGIPVPWTRRLKNVREIRSPVFIKPNIGTGSRNCYVVNTNREYSALREYLIMVDDFIVQEYLVGQQWTVDVLVLDGVFINALTRKDLVMRAGNTVTAEVKQNKDLEELAFNIYKKLNIRSPFNIEAIETGDGFRVIEVNARFGSGVIFTVLAGCDTISYTATRDEKYLGSVKEGIYSRYYEELYVS